MAEKLCLAIKLQKKSDKKKKEDLNCSVVEELVHFADTVSLSGRHALFF